MVVDEDLVVAGGSYIIQKLHLAPLMGLLIPHRHFIILPIEMVSQQEQKTEIVYVYDWPN